MATTRARRWSVAAGVLAVGAGGACRAQECGSRWVSDPLFSANGGVYELCLWDRDGAGPMTPVVVVAGDFSRVGDVAANRIAVWDPEAREWSALGSGIDGPVFSLAALPNGRIVAGGTFLNAGGVAVNRIAQWDGVAWSALGSGVTVPNGAVEIQAMTVMQNGDLVVGGIFATAGGVAASNVARWNGSAWSAMGTGLNAGGFGTGVVSALTTMSDGRVMAGGSFSVPTRCIAQWTGAAWSAVGWGATGAPYCFLPLANGWFVAGGSFGYIGDVTALRIVRSNGTVWQPLNVGVHGGTYYSVNTVNLLPGGALAAAGSFTLAGMPGIPVGNIAKWENNAWVAMGSGLNAGVSSSVVLNGELLVGGSFTTAGGVPAAHLARWTEQDSPWFDGLPRGLTARRGQTVRLSAIAGAGYSDVTVRWYRNRAAITDGPEGASVGGGVVSGAVVTRAVSDGVPFVLTIAGAAPSDGGNYTAVITNACGEDTSVPVVVVVGDGCGADVNRDGAVDGEDVLSFFGAWDAGEIAADFNFDGGVDADDVIAFFGSWDAGC